MSIFIRAQLAKQLKEIHDLNKSKNLVSVLLGTIDAENNEIIALTALHLPNSFEDKNDFFNDELFSQLEALNKILPYSLRSIGVAFYDLSEKPSSTIITLSKKMAESKNFLMIVDIGKNSFNYYSVSATNPVKLTTQEIDCPIENTFSIIHTIEFEASDKILDNITLLKESFVKELNEHWDKIIFNKNEELTIEDIISEKRILDRIIEINIPCDEKKLSTKTEKNNVFLAFDLHMNIYPQKDIRNKKLSDLTKFFNQVLTQDLVLKLQRAYYDKNNKSLFTPAKKPIEFYGFNLNGYLSKENPSKYEYELLDKIIFHAEIMSKIGLDSPSRTCLLGLQSYFNDFNDKKKIEMINSIIQKYSHY